MTPQRNLKHWFLQILSCLLLFTFNNLNAQKKSSIDENTEYEITMIKEGLVDVSTIDASIKVQLKYATSDNFIHFNVYGNLHKAFLQPEVAKRLAKAQQALKLEHPELSLVIFDAARPYRVQCLMWQRLNQPEKKKHLYLADPKIGSLHNFGCAVDLSIVDKDGKELDMGTPFDFFGEKAYPIREKKMLAKGILNTAQIKNRDLLRKYMFAAGFDGTTTEWWHFNACSRNAAKLKYRIIP